MQEILKVLHLNISEISTVLQSDKKLLNTYYHFEGGELGLTEFVQNIINLSLICSSFTFFSNNFEDIIMLCHILVQDCKLIMLTIIENLEPRYIESLFSILNSIFEKELGIIRKS